MRSKFRNSQQPYAIIIGLDSMQGLQAARILADRKVPVIGIASDPKFYGCKTKVCEQILFTDTSSRELIKTLEVLGPKLSQLAVLFPCQDPNVLVISRNRQHLEQWYRIMLPESDVVEMMMDKVIFYQYAQQNCFPIPQTVVLKCREDTEQAAKKLKFPCILKPPYRPESWTKHTKSKGFKITNAEELMAMYDHYCNWVDVLIAQEWIEGTEKNLYSCNCYFDSNSNPLVTFVARKIRQWPPRTGQSCLGEECRNDTVLRETIRLFSSVNYCGLGYLEMKQDEISGKHFIVEPNIGRPTGRSAIAEAGGVELLYTMYCDAVGISLPANREQKYKGVKWVHILRDLQSAFFYWRRSELTLRDWQRSLSGPKAYAVLSWRDPLPFLTALYRAIPIMFSSRERGKEDYHYDLGL